MAHGKYVSFTTAALHNVRVQRDLEVAAELLQDCLIGRRKSFGVDHPLTKESVRANGHAERKLKDISSSGVGQCSQSMASGKGAKRMGDRPEKASHAKKHRSAQD